METSKASSVYLFSPSLHSDDGGKSGQNVKFIKGQKSLRFPI